MRSSGASGSLQQSQGRDRALLLLPAQAEVCFVLAARCTHSWNTPGCVHACTCPARNKVSWRRGVLPVHLATGRKEEQPQHLLILSCCRGGTSRDPSSHVQLQEQLLYPGPQFCSPFTLTQPHRNPFPSTRVVAAPSRRQGSRWWHCTAPCPSATAKDRAGETST